MLRVKGGLRERGRGGEVTSVVSRKWKCLCLPQLLPASSLPANHRPYLPQARLVQNIRTQWFVKLGIEFRLVILCVFMSYERRFHCLVAKNRNWKFIRTTPRVLNLRVLYFPNAFQQSKRFISFCQNYLCTTLVLHLKLSSLLFLRRPLFSQLKINSFPPVLCVQFYHIHHRTA